MSEFLPAKDAAALLARLHFMSLTTSSLKAVPWCSPVFFAYDRDLNFYWLSSPDARHSVNIHENPATSIVVYDSSKKDGDGWGLYLEGISEQIADPAIIKMAHETCFARIGREPMDTEKFTGDAARKYYIFRPSKAWTNGLVQKDGFKVDVRQEIPLPDLKTLLQA